LPPSGPAGGDLTGTYPDPLVDPLKVADRMSGNSNALLVLANALCAKLDECIASVFKRCDGSAHVAGDLIPTCQEMQDAIARVSSSLVDCNGNPFMPGAHVPTCDQVDSRITQAVGSIPADKFLQDVQYDPTTHKITFKVADGGGTFTVNLSDLLPIVVGQGLSGNGTVATPADIRLAPSSGLTVSSTGTAVKLSGDAANALALGSDKGLYVPNLSGGQTSQVTQNKDYGQADWVAAGSPVNWALDDLLVPIPDAMLSKTVLLCVHQDCYPVLTSDFLYLNTRVQNTAAASVLPMFQMGGVAAGVLNSTWNQGIPVPTWGMYLINAEKKAMASGTKLQVVRTIYDASYTGTGGMLGIIRVYQTATLIALG
jgi:hypothetical protein